MVVISWVGASQRLATVRTARRITATGSRPTPCLHAVARPARFRAVTARSSARCWESRRACIAREASSSAQPVLLFGGTKDPQTAFTWTADLAKSFHVPTVVTFRGEGRQERAVRDQRASRGPPRDTSSRAHCPRRHPLTERTASVVIRGHALIRNLRRGHCERGTDAAPPGWVASAFDDLALAT